MLKEKISGQEKIINKDINLYTLKLNRYLDYNKARINLKTFNI